VNAQELREPTLKQKGTNDVSATTELALEIEKRRRGAWSEEQCF